MVNALTEAGRERMIPRAKKNENISIGIREQSVFQTMTGITSGVGLMYRKCKRMSEMLQRDTLIKRKTQVSRTYYMALTRLQAFT